MENFANFFCNLPLLAIIALLVAFCHMKTYLVETGTKGDKEKECLTKQNNQKL